MEKNEDHIRGQEPSSREQKGEGVTDKETHCKPGAITFADELFEGWCEEGAEDGFGLASVERSHRVHFV